MPTELSSEQRDQLEALLSDLEHIFTYPIIRPELVEEVCAELSTTEVASYLRNLRDGAKPETALRENLLAGPHAILAHLIFGAITPETWSGDGFVDYRVMIDSGRPVLIELKPPFVRKIVEGRYEALQRQPLNWEQYEGQINKYLKEHQYIILTNLRELYAFSNREDTPLNDEPYSLRDFKDRAETVTLSDFLHRMQQQAIRHDLDEEFFDSLDQWVGLLSEIRFDGEISDSYKRELIIRLINKFIFIQTLDDCHIVDFNWIQRNWDREEHDWLRRGAARFLTEFLKRVDNFFYTYYDTELFKTDILPYVDQNQFNLQRLYRTLKNVLGIERWQRDLGGRGLLQFYFADIDEDILGKAYERYLAKLRNEEGIYYTPSFISEYMVECTVTRQLDSIISRISNSLESANYNDLMSYVTEFIKLRIIDPSCGSGSFLVKVLRSLWDKYLELYTALESKEKEILSQSEDGGDNDRLPFEAPRELETIREAKQLIGQPGAFLLARILLRHVHGNDKDRRAIEVAKVNLWLEAVKLAPQYFSLNKIEPDTDHILPDLQGNLTNGDSLIGLSFGSTYQRLAEDHQNDVSRLSSLRDAYIENPNDIQPVQEIEQIRERLRGLLRADFHQYWKDLGLDEYGAPPEDPLHWPLEHWHSFFDDSGRRKIDEQLGFDVVIGNPPWGGQLSPAERVFLREYETDTRIPNSYIYFQKLAEDLTKHEKDQSFVLPDSILVKAYPESRRRIVQSRTIEEIAFIHNTGIPTRQKPFPDVNHDLVIFDIHKALPEDDSTTRVRFIPGIVADIAELNSREMHQSLWDDGQLEYRINLLLTPSRIAIRNRISEVAWQLQRDFESHEGIHSGNVREKLFFPPGEKPATGNVKPLIMGASHGDVITPYFFDWAGWHVLYDPTVFDASQGERASLREERIFLEPKLFVVRTGRRFHLALDRQQYYASNNVFCLLKRENAEEDYALEFMLALLNSRLLQWYLRTFIAPRFGALYTETKIAHLDLLPIRRILFTTPRNQRDTLRNELVNLFTSAELRKLMRMMQELIPLDSDGRLSAFQHNATEYSDVVYDFMIHLACEMTALKNYWFSEQAGFLKWLEGFIGTSIQGLRNSSKLQMYYLEEEEKIYEILMTNKVPRLQRMSNRDFQTTLYTEIKLSKSRLGPILRKAQITERLIDRVTERLYGLSPEISRFISRDIAGDS